MTTINEVAAMLGMTKSHCARKRERAIDGPFYVYVAGPLSDLPSEYLANVVAISRVSRALIDEGYVPINPAADLIDGLMSGDPIPIAVYHRRSMHLLRLLVGKRAAVFVVATHHRGGRKSTGVADEITEAKRSGIPIVFNFAALEACANAV